MIKGRKGSTLDSLYRDFSNCCLDPFIAWLGRAWKNAWKKWNKYTDLNPDYIRSHFMISGRFIIKSIGGYRICYGCRVGCERVNKEEFKAARMLDPSARKKLMDDYHEQVFFPHFAKNGYFFHFSWRPIGGYNEQEIVRTPVCQLIEMGEERAIREIPQTSIDIEFYEKKKFRKNGCDVELMRFYNHIFPDQLIEENYAMLTEEQRQEVEAHPAYSPLVERIAVAALKRRLEFFGKLSSQRHEADDFQIESEKAGRAVRIRWSFNERRRSDYELLGFRKIEGFHKDVYALEENGKLVVHSLTDGEIVETLPDGQAFFYTFYMRSGETNKDGKRDLRSPLRFQLAVSPREETETMEYTLKLLATKKPVIDPARENLTQALKKIDAYVEMDKAFDAAQKSFIEEIGNAEYSEEEKARKIERFEAVITHIRSDYEPV